MLRKYLVRVVIIFLLFSTIGVCVRAETKKEQVTNKVELNTSDSKYDPRELGLVTPVKNQGALSTCWDFAGMATMESFLKLKGYGEYDLSEEHARWWGTTDEEGYGWRRGADDFGWQETFLGYITSGVGPKLETDIPYLEGSKIVNMNTAITKFRVTDVVYVDSKMDSVKSAIINYGAVSSRYNNDLSFLSTNGEAYNCNSYENSKLGHMVAIVGWDDNYPKENFNEKIRPMLNGAWLIKNSWGQTVGDNGYLWISYEDMYLLKSAINFSIKSITPVDIKSKIYQHDQYGSTMSATMYDFNSENSYNKITCANVYDFNEEYNVLDSVMFNTDSKEANYEIYYGPFVDNTIQLDKKVKIAEGIIKDRGYLTVPINLYELPKGKGAILITIEYPNLDNVANIGCEMSRSLDDAYEFKAKVNPGESYIIINDRAIDTTKIKPMNFTIKAVTKKPEINPINDWNNVFKSEITNKIQLDNKDNLDSQQKTDKERNSKSSMMIWLGVMIIATLGVSIIIINKVWKE